MRIGVLGSGLMGGKLGSLFARAGHDVIFSYSRTRQKLEHLARDAGARAHVGTPAEAARDADALLLAVHWTRVDDVLAQAGTLTGKVLLTCSLPMSKDDTHLLIGHTTSGAEALAAKVRGAMWYPPSVRFPVRCWFRYSRDVERNRRRTWSFAETTKEQRRQPLI